MKPKPGEAYVRDGEVRVIGMVTTWEKPNWTGWEIQWKHPEDKIHGPFGVCGWSRSGNKEWFEWASGATKIETA